MPTLFEKDMTGKPEYWTDVMAIAETASTPFTSMVAKRSKPGQVEIKQQVKKYPEVGHTGVLDGKDATEFTSNQGEEVYFRGQKVWHNPAISDFADEAEKKAVKSLWSEQVADAIIAVKRKIEKRCLSDAPAAKDDGATTPNETAGVFMHVRNTAQPVYPFPEEYRTPATSIYSGTLANFNESTFKALGRSSYKQRKGPGRLHGFLGIDLKEKFTDFSIYTDTPDADTKVPVRTFNHQSGNRALISVIDKLVTDTGEYLLHPSSYLLTDRVSGADTAATHRSGIFLDMTMVGLTFTRQVRVKELENKGGGPRAIVDAIFALVFDNPLGHIALNITAE